jgi:hypothetical protein
MKHLGMFLMIAGIAAFITSRLNVNLPEGLSLPTLPTDMLGGILLLAGVFWNVFYDVNK